MRGVGASTDDCSITRLTRREIPASRAATAMAAVASSNPSRVGKINRRNVLHRALDGADVEEVAFEYFGAERAQLVGTLIDLVDEGANRNSALKQHFGYMPSGLALPAAGRGSDENWLCHGYGSFTFCPGLVPCGTSGFEHMVRYGTKSRET